MKGLPTCGLDATVVLGGVVNLGDCTVCKTDVDAVDAAGGVWSIVVVTAAVVDDRALEIINLVGVFSLGLLGTFVGICGVCKASVRARVVSCTVWANSSFKALMFKLKLGDLRKVSNTDGVSVECFCGVNTGANRDEALDAGVLIGGVVLGKAGACITADPPTFASIGVCCLTTVETPDNEE